MGIPPFPPPNEHWNPETCIKIPSPNTSKPAVKGRLNYTLFLKFLFVFSMLLHILKLFLIYEVLLASITAVVWCKNVGCCVVTRERFSNPNPHSTLVDGFTRVCPWGFMKMHYFMCWLATEKQLGNKFYLWDHRLNHLLMTGFFATKLAI